MKELKKVDPDKIYYDDDRFCYKAVKEADKREGFSFDIPFLWETDEGYVPLKPMKKADGSEIDAFVYPKDMDYETLLLELISRDDLTLYDMAAIVEKLERYSNNIDRKQWSKRLGFPVDKWEEVRQLNGHEQVWKNYFVEKRTPLKRLLHFSDAGLRDILASVLNMNPGINILESIAGLLKEIAQRDKTSIDETWMSLDLNPVVHDLDLTAPQKLQEIRSRLYATRYPTIAAYRARLEKHLGDIPRSAKIDIRSDENFETPGMRLQADIRSGGDIDTLRSWLDAQQRQLEEIIDLQKEDYGKDENKN